MSLRLYYRFLRMKLHLRMAHRPMSRAEGYRKLGEVAADVKTSAAGFEKKLHEVENLLRHGR